MPGVLRRIEGENTQFDTFRSSPMNRVLVHHALASAGYGGRRVRLVTGLPVANFFSGGRKNERNVEAKRANLPQGVAGVSSDDPVTTVPSAEVGCRALAAFVDYWLDDELKERDVPFEKVAVVDLDGRTTDIAHILDG